MFQSKGKSLSLVLDDKWNTSHDGFADVIESLIKKN